ncbi:membrane-anchored ubiquitin-fold protein 3 isoform X1 [Phoenix dactylifera]|uniref:Membrane-anchored ubiquitin-fold protein 3 isoform X1 n=1 Tax=Phoenix dactylifera TaxID=42345 RepID=A0A8B7CKB3_PHODC|nr:membrane-anchored ubiquitin-fold protein 3 isoform X1 [Phoenix dactylifera]
MAGEDLIELKFRLFDGTDLGPNKYDPSTTVASLKETILARWPQDKEIAPKTINDLKLINAGKILENNRTLAESRVSVGEIPGGVITMHVVVRPPQLDKNNVFYRETACECPKAEQMRMHYPVIPNYSSLDHLQLAFWSKYPYC